ncbi:nucleoside 2-deoxyribosyltransferase [Massilia sp. KIM]|uniref:nucleoside 2-deoxyribosyltransferase n=1 Tax=Massilia sp. KIM TaxID=1955422 RepID=UPI0015C40215|nr:nucleoside 2-deoxyribosyltransferase [Massilia sp. KIM]
MAVFHGKMVPFNDPNDPSTMHNDGADSGVLLADTAISSGLLSANITFDEVTDKTQAGLILWSDPSTSEIIVAVLSRQPWTGPMFVIRRFDGKTWHDLPGSSGDGSILRAKHSYEVQVRVEGSTATMTVDGVQVTKSFIPAGLRQSSAGIYCFSRTKVTIADFKVEPERPKAFVVMQFTQPFNELWTGVVEPICRNKGVDAKRADDDYGPGMIISDVVASIRESAVVIAEITPTNANVYYEVGYAHALGKPTILIAEKGTKLPFDISGFRVLMYENSIDGKAKFEQGLIKHLDAVLSQ